MKLEIIYETVGKWHENSYCINLDGEAWIIDPGDSFLILDASFSLASCRVKGIFCTHAHFDHIGAAAAFIEKYSLPFYLHSDDKKILRQANLYRKLAGSSDFFEVPKVISFINEHSSFSVGSKQIIVHHTPGHTAGSVTFQIENNLFTGDLLFKTVLGRVDLPGGNIELIKRSANFILTNFKDYNIYPGHGEPFVLTQNVINNLNQFI